VLLEPSPDIGFTIKCAGHPLAPHDHYLTVVVFESAYADHLHDANGVADQSFAPITLDIASVTVETRAPAEALHGRAAPAEA
jgi:hypothetical protein